MFKSAWFSLIAAVLFTTPVFAQNAPCWMTIRSSSVQLPSGSIGQGLCVEDFFQTRDLGFHGVSATEGIPAMAPANAMQVNEMLLFKLAKDSGDFGASGRQELAEKVFATMRASLHNSHGTCTLSMRDGDRELLASDFVVSERSDSGQPGTRILLKSENGLTQPQWALSCRNETGTLETVKHGDYFFVFVDIYENKNPLQIGNGLHMISYLFSFN